MLLDEKVLDRELYNAKKDLLPDITLDISYNLSSNEESFSKITNHMEDKFYVSLSDLSTVYRTRNIKL